MNTTRTIVVAIVAVVTPGGTRYVSGAQILPSAIMSSMAASGQSGSRNADPKREVTSLLTRARKAMTEADWDTAESLVAQAEAQHVQFGKLHFGDTPEKARRDLERARPVNKTAQKPGAKVDGTSQIPPARQALGAGNSAATAGKTAAARPRGMTIEPAPRNRGNRGADNFPPVSEQAAAPRGRNPFDVVDQAAAQSEPSVVRLPTAVEDPSQGVATVSAEVVPVEPATNEMPATATLPPGNQRAESDRLILAARKALAVGDAPQAARFAAQAKSLNVRYDLHDDNPAKVAAQIQKYNELSQMRVPKDSEAYRRRYAELLLTQAEVLMQWKEFDDAERLVTDAARLPISYGPFDVKPNDMLNRVAAARRQSGRFRDNNVAPAGMEQPVAPDTAATSPLRGAELRERPAGENPVRTSAPPSAQAGGGQRAIYEPDRDTTQNVPAAATSSGPALSADQSNKLFDMPAPNAMAARRVSGEAPGEIPPQEAAIDAPPEPIAAPQRLPAVPESSAGALLQKTAVDQQVLARKVIADLAAQKSEAKRVQETDPKRSLEILKQARAMVEKSGLDQETRDRLLRSADRGIAEVEQYIEINRPKIELAERNQAVKDEIDRDQKAKVEVQEKLAYMVDDFNKLMDEQRFAEAEVVAKRAQELSPDEPVVQQLLLQAKFIRRLANVRQIQDAKEEGFVTQLNNVEASAEGFDDNKPYQFASIKEWDQITKSKFRQKIEGRARRSEKELEIEKSLKTPVSLKFQDAPLSEVMDHLKTLAGVNIHLDPRGLAAEGTTTETPVTIDLTEPISLRSALNLILEPLHLSYVVKNEVLSITSEQLRDVDVYSVTYNVGDLVIPIPNFAPDVNMGLSGALNAAQANARAGMVGSVFAGDAPLALASNSGSNANIAMDSRILAQIGGNSPTSGPLAGIGQSMGSGPGGLSGGIQPDFDSLIDLIVQTIQPESWDANGGPGSVTRFPNNLSLVISQKQEVHEEIADLLAQLRRLQDLQVTIEVRFITLNDNFFERIGVDFQFSLQDYAPGTLVGNQNVGTLNQGSALSSYDPQLYQKNSATVGTSGPGFGQFTDDLNIDLTQGSYAAAVPQFGGFAAGTGATLGFAILSDIEAFFFIEAAQGDRRSNVLQAPKVTLFNGQMATVSDVSQSPFVISVIPVVGDFAAAQQPVIVVLSEGTMLTVQAVVSEDRRFVRLTLVPFFSSIGQVNTFTFTGSSSTTSNTSSLGPTDATTGRSNATSTTTEGTTVQLPTFSFVSVSTTVSVPDGGTVLLGGVKRLSEGRNEFGVPILNKLPYVNRLFQNTAIGRQTESLMMMVTPRIIIQEEEEFNLTGQTPPTP